MTAPQTHFSDQPFFQLLKPEAQNFLIEQASVLRLSLQDCRQTCEIALDLQMWGMESIQDVWPVSTDSKQTGKAQKQLTMTRLRAHWEALKSSKNTYPSTC